jgi:hypothetical protein
MPQKTIRASGLRWRLPYYAAIVAFVVFVPIAICDQDTFLFVSVFIVAPILITISLVSFVCLILAAVRDGRRQILPALAMLIVIWVIPASLFLYERTHPFELHDIVRWMVHSRQYKSEVLAQPTSGKAELKHIEWDASGLAGIANNTVFLVFDPDDTLSMAAESRQPGKINGIACEVRSVRRLESHWYAVLFYTDEYWGQGECK